MVVEGIIIDKCYFVRGFDSCLMVIRVMEENLIKDKYYFISDFVG